MLSAVNDFNKKQDLDFSVRIGINSGPVIAGVVGKKKYAYDLWGDTVNVAARMETSGAPGQIHLSDNTYRLISDKYNFTRREPLKIKGKGLMQTYLLKPD
jgi:adenylate cyclase